MVPRWATPSCKARIAVIAPPHVPPAVKLNDCDTDAPPAETMPYVCGLLGEVTSSVPKSVATRLVVSAVPVFFTARLMVTVSPGYTTPLVRVQFSADNVQPLVTITGNVLSMVRPTGRVVLPDPFVIFVKTTVSE